MSLSPAEEKLVNEFRAAVETELAADPRFAPPAREDRPDGSTRCSRFHLGGRLWLEVAVRPQIPQIRVGIMSDDRWVNEELEEAIEETGDTMPEFIEAGFDEVGLEWLEPLVEHYRDQGKYFYFATAWEPARLADLAQPAAREKTRLMACGYYEAFRKPIERAREAAALE